MPPRARKKAKGSDGSGFQDFTQTEEPSQRLYHDEHRHFERIAGEVQRSETVAAVPLSPTKKRVITNTSNDDGLTLPAAPFHRTDEMEKASAWLESMHLAPGIWDDPEPVSESNDAEQSQEQSEKKRKRTQADDPLDLFTERIEEYLEELLRLDGMGSAEERRSCHRCNVSLTIDGGATYRCRDCAPNVLWCGDCVVEDHRRVYLHRIQKWNGKFFERVTLMSLGLRVQLGHTHGERCTRPRAAFNDEFTVIDSDGFHTIALDYCGCNQGLSPVRQLLRARLFPATTIDPRCATTFRALETYQMLSFTGKISAYEFLLAIFRRTDNTWNVTPDGRTDQSGELKLKDRNKEFMRTIHEWRFLRCLKRLGRGHDEGGAAGTEEGDCALLCPACPQLGINMPAKWESIPEEKRWLYALFLAMDANFRLRRKDVSSDERDPGLNRGYAYLVLERAYKEFLKKYGGDVLDEKNTCNTHDAIKSANVRGGQGFAASGMGAVQCSRHDMRRPVGAGDLQKGERYCNMDYVMLKTLGFHKFIPQIIILSYDIACQWYRYLMERCERYPENCFTGDHGKDVIFLVPKFHLPAHVTACQLNFSFNLTPGVGRTDGEAPERGWSISNHLAASTREMGPGNRRDTLDDNFGDLNWTKTVGMAHTLARRAATALEKRAEQVEAFVEFAAALPLASRKKWTKQVKAWEKDQEKPNPYDNEQTVLTTAAVRNRLAQEDKKALSEGIIDEVHADVSRSMFILQGIELEEAHTVLERGNALFRRIEAWTTLQRLYAPKSALLRADADDRDSFTLSPWKIPLGLPSDNISTMACYDLRLIRYEFQFRIAQAESTLKSLRGLLLYQAHMLNSKKAYSSGTTANTRSNSVIQEVANRINIDVEKYRKIRIRLTLLWSSLKKGPLTGLEKEAGWEKVLLELKAEDVVGVTSMDQLGLGEGEKSLTWIWTVAGTGHDTSEVANTALRIEFCRARARAQRWQEECLLLAEEMIRVERFFAWDAARWVKRATALERTRWTIDFRKEINRGKMAFAWRQASLRTSLGEKARSTHRDYIARLQKDSELIECVK
ncbi:hypothetical protein DFP72DRAFT_986468 [Ephemerocybe angulata]|uniref:CxC2-like cysteine cluster KDZ transposase-associated domain-containing protein n=1 Tax=Ephemerocybe angulata TaxID=980116 RepID=A0A8H6IHP5_9AGAR|nr:hypothetical protein DFP72DRAFT_986468 [Tulosesus angulatus]